MFENALAKYLMDIADAYTRGQAPGSALLGDIDSHHRGDSVTMNLVDDRGGVNTLLAGDADALAPGSDSTCLSIVPSVVQLGGKH
jgi:hypothetical protein